MKVHIFGKKQVLYVVLAIILLCIGMVCALRAVNRLGAAEAAAGITDWGLSFQSEGAPPVANASQEYLKNFDALYVGDTNKKEIYITFDAGFENGNTERILDALKKHGVKATFFLVGNYFETQPKLVKRMAEEGHTIGNHTYSHPDMSKIGDIQSFQTELQKNEALYRDVLGSEMPKLYRPPQGKFCEENLKMAQQLGYSTVFWSLAYVDWYTDDQPTPEQAFSKLLPRIHPGAVVLLHSTSSTNAEILDELLTKWEETGYSFGDLEAYCAAQKTS
ncbi:polysaccharide deacetylase family protein [Hominenteromicrobium mulieris]|uniref:polysaccharide deacetylase family protein n=1 Tax=Hominenteromicrobium TaxID=3073575 RepID=UPI003A90EA47